MGTLHHGEVQVGRVGFSLVEGEGETTGGEEERRESRMLSPLLGGHWECAQIRFRKT